jgi:hypothetical protein
LGYREFFGQFFLIACAGPHAVQYSPKIPNSR